MHRRSLSRFAILSARCAATVRRVSSISRLFRDSICSVAGTECNESVIRHSRTESGKRLAREAMLQITGEQLRDCVFNLRRRDTAQEGLADGGITAEATPQNNVEGL
jgi:hypothetical protein